MRTVLENDELLPKPTSREAAIADIRKIFKWNKWDRRDQTVFLESLNLTPQKLELFTDAEIKQILREFVRLRMVLYRR